MSKSKPKLNLRDSRTLKRLTEMADNVVSAAQRGRDPAVDIPPARSPISATTSRGGSWKWAATPTAGNCSTCRRPRPTCKRMLVANGVNRLIEEGKTASLRSMFYMLKHDVEGTKEPTFEDQDESRPDHRGLRGPARQPPRGAAPVRREGRRHGRQHRADRQRRRDRLLPHGLRRLRHPLDRRARGDPVQEVRRQVRPARRKGHGLAAVQRGQVLAEATTAF